MKFVHPVITDLADARENFEQIEQQGMWTGTGAPSVNVGINGDFYFRRDGAAGTTIYQRRAGAWVGIV